MSLSKWKELAAEKTKTGKMKQNLLDEITAEKIRSKTTDQAIAKTFRLHRLDQIAEQTKPKAKRQDSKFHELIEMEVLITLQKQIPMKIWMQKDC